MIGHSGGDFFPEGPFMSEIVLGIDVGGTKCGVCLATTEGGIIDKDGFPTKEPEGPDQAVRNFIETSHRLIAKHSVKITGIGIACGSPLDPDTGIVDAPPHLQSWKKVPVVKIFQDEFGVPAFLDNDANAGACAEYLFGAGKGCRHMVFLTFGTGLGGGIIANGDIYRGANCFAGEVGHIRLEKDGPVGVHKAGSFEGFCSGAGIAQIARGERAKWTGKTLVPEQPTTKDVGEAAEQGDELALRIMTLSGHYLGYGLAYIVDILNPERIIIGSIFLRCEKFLRPSMEETLRREAMPQTFAACQILPAGLGERIGDYAALSVAMLQMKKKKEL